MEEREGRKGNGVCRKKKEGTGESRSSFEEDTGRNEKICG